MDGRDWVMDKVEGQDKWRGECINLIASENVTSRWVQRAYAGDFSHRYAEGTPFNRGYQGTRFIDEVEDRANKFFADHFGAARADVRPVSGAIANMAVMRAFAKPGNVMAALSVPAGAHSSHTGGGVAGGILALSTVELAFDTQEWRIDADLSSKIIRSARPKLVVVGASLIPFPLELEGIAEACQEVGARLIYDGAHVFGLMFSGEFQDPFKEGADMITASTHKTFPGPQGGVIISRDEDRWDKVEQAVFPKILSSHHLHHVPAALMAGYEMEEFGQEYSKQILSNARKLAEELFDLGFDVLGEDRGFTRSHQVVLDMRKQGGGLKPARALEEANIILNKNLLPWDTIMPETLQNPSGIRIGVQEMTRVGMKEEEMGRIAELLSRVALKGEKPEKVKEDTVGLRREFQEVHYTWVGE